VARNPKLTDLLKSFDRWEGKGKGLASLTDACLENTIDLPYYTLMTDEIKLFIPKSKIYDDAMEIWLNSFSGFINELYGKELSEE
jgi:predicted HTH transcriptional regulator